MRAADRPNRQQSGGAGSQDAIPDISDFGSWAVLILPSEKILLFAFLDELRTQRLASTWSTRRISPSFSEPMQH